MSTVASTRFYHSQNSNHLDQNIGLRKHKGSLLVNDNTAVPRNVTFLKKKRNYYETIHDGSLGITEMMWDSAIGMKILFVCHRFFKTS